MKKQTQKKQVPIFFVSSGRTGSTFLARFLNDHPRILVASDLFEPLGPNHYFNTKTMMSGKRFFELMSRPSVKPRLRFWKNSANRERLFYPIDENLVSLLLCYTIPFLSERPMDLFYEIKEKVSKFPDLNPSQHTIKFFELLRERFHKEIWVERTGGSLPQIDKIVKTWPDAKYIYNYRDGRETAISMYRHPIFRMYCQMLKKPDLDEWDPEYYPPIEEFGKMWEDWTMLAEKSLGKIPTSKKMNLAYEELETNLQQTLLSLLNFIFDQPLSTDEDIKWVKKWIFHIKMAPRRFEKLSENEQIRLELSCRKGLKTLGYTLKFSKK